MAILACLKDRKYAYPICGALGDLGARSPQHFLKFRLNNIASKLAPSFVASSISGTVSTMPEWELTEKAGGHSGHEGEGTGVRHVLNIQAKNALFYAFLLRKLFVARDQDRGRLNHARGG